VDFLQEAQHLQDDLTALRRDFHQHPELGFRETRTAGRVVEELTRLGIELRAGVGKTGVVGVIGEGSPAIGIRADMDALPILEANDVPYASQNPGMMHACGHDGHTAMLLGVARLLTEMPNRPPGEIRLLFQPCEETTDEENLSGSPRMIEDGALDGLDAVIALHVASEAPVGIVMVDDGFICAASDSFEATIYGEGGHGAYPHQAVDPIYILGHVLLAIQGLRARRVDPTASAVISVGTVQAGTANNVIPGEVKLTGTIRSFDDAVREKLHAELERAFSVAEALGGRHTLTIQRGYPAGWNDPAVSDVLRQAAVAAVGQERVISVGASMGAEDFAYMTQKVPGAMFMLGAQLGTTLRPHHSDTFDIDEAALPIGAAVLADAACRLLQIHRKD
jgi:amidohydrolase